MRRAERGAVFLLSVYFLAISLLVLFGISLQRTLLDMRVAEASRSLQQAFYVSEAGLDAAIYRNREQAVQRLAEGASFPCATIALGDATCRVQTLSNTVTMTSQGPVFDMVHAISATGQLTSGSAPASATSAVATAVMRTRAIFRGGVTLNGELTAVARDWRERLLSDGSSDTRYEPINVSGHLQTGLGEWSSYDLGAGVRIRGNVTIGPTAARHGWERLVGDNPGSPFNQYNAEGVYLAGADPPLPAARIDGTIQAAPMPLLPPAQLPMACQQAEAASPRGWLGDLKVAGGTWRETRGGGRVWVGGGQLEIKDGFVDPSGSGIHDMTPTGDGHVVLCVDSVSIGEDAHVTIRDPTLLYMDKNYAWGFTNDGTVRTYGNLTNRYDRGFTVIATDSDTDIVLGDFEGSVYAPTSAVTLHPTSREEGYDSRSALGMCYPTPPDRKLGFVVANSLDIYGVDLDFGVRHTGHGKYALRGTAVSSPMSTVSDSATQPLADPPLGIVMWSGQSANVTSSMSDDWARWTQYATGTQPNASSSSSSTDQTSTASSGSSTTISLPTTGGGGGSTAICTELHRQGYLPETWFEADKAYAAAHIDPRTRAAYLAWAQPLVRQMQRSRLVTRMVRPFGLAWAQHMAYQMGASEQDNRLGRWINNVGLPVHRVIGGFMRRHPSRSL